MQAPGFLGSANGGGCGNVLRWEDAGLLALVWLEYTEPWEKGDESVRIKPWLLVVTVRISAFTRG